MMTPGGGLLGQVTQSVGDKLPPETPKLATSSFAGGGPPLGCDPHKLPGPHRGDESWEGD